MLPKRRYMPLNPTERALIEHMLSADRRGYATLRAQLPSALHVAHWFPGSPSFDIQVADDAPLYSDDSTLSGEIGNIVGAHGVYRDGGHPVDSEQIGDIFLWVKEGKLAALEYAWTSERMPLMLPAISQLAAD